MNEIFQKLRQMRAEIAQRTDHKQVGIEAPVDEREALILVCHWFGKDLHCRLRYDEDYIQKSVISPHYNFVERCVASYKAHHGF